MIDGVSEILESITRRRWRAIATAIGVFWGTLMVTLLLGGARGLRNGFGFLYEDSSVNSIWIEAGRTSEPFEGLGAGRVLQLDAGDLAALESHVPEIENVSPRHALAPGLTIAYNTRTASVPIYGVYTGYAVAEKTKIVRGRWLNELDVDRARKVVVIGRRVAEILFHAENPVGHSVVIGGIEFLVIGEFTDAGGEDEIRRAYIPYTTLTQTFDATRLVKMLVATLRDGRSVAAARERIVRTLARRHRFDPEDPSALEIWAAEEDYRKVQTLLHGIDLATVVLGLGTLISGIIGVSNILFVSVRERAQEFGLRRALGATSGSILRLVLAEAVFLSTLAGGGGLLVGAGLLRFGRRAELSGEYFRDPSVDVGASFGALGVLVFTSLVAGYFPAREAARTNPIEALRRG